MFDIWMCPSHQIKRGHRIRYFNFVRVCIEYNADLYAHWLSARHWAFGCPTQKNNKNKTKYKAIFMLTFFKYGQFGLRYVFFIIGLYCLCWFLSRQYILKMGFDHISRI